jgi:hypothetical protein
VESRSDGGPVDPTLRVTLNFHPDRVDRGVPILAAMAADGVVRTQFETGVGNGGLTAYPGGDRWRWESRMFGGAYDTAEPGDRPKYGGLDVYEWGVGASPRFGSAHLRLSAATLARSTFCFPDSVFDPVDFGVADRMPLGPLAAAAGHDVLDDYVEAHVHGPVELARDVEALVLDPYYRDTPVAEYAAQLPCPVRWHTGFRLDVAELARHPEYRGPEYVALGEAIARDGVLDPEIIGAADRSGRHDPQALKRVWHYLARFGHAYPLPPQGYAGGPDAD